MPNIGTIITASFNSAFFGVVNFIPRFLAGLIILLIGGMIAAKQFAFGSTGAIIDTFSKYSRGLVGGATIGAAGYAARGTIGRAASGLADAE